MLTEQQKRWTQNLEEDFADLPAGMAEGMVRLWSTKPEFFSAENFAKMKAEPPPKLDRTSGEMRLATPEEIEELLKKQAAELIQPEPC